VETIGISEMPTAVSPNIFVATIAITTGIISQLLIPGSFLASMFTSLPAWRWFDPISILNGRGRQKTLGSGVNRSAISKKVELEELLK
jgi:hypothetical protein